MGEMNENAVQPQLESVVEQPNNQLGEQQIEAIVPSQEATGAVVEEPKPIVEQQIALDVNVEDVFAGGTTKEDEITQIVTDAVKNAEESLIEEPIPTVIQPPVVETPVAEVPLPEVPAVEIPVSEPIAETAITEVPVQTEEAPAPAVQVPTPEVPVVEQPVVEVPVPEVPAVEVPVTESVPTEPVVTLEPGPVSDIQDLSAMAAPMDIAAPAVDIPTPEVPVVEQPVAEIPIIENSLPEVAVPESAIPDVPVAEVVPTEPVVTLEPGPVSDIQDLSAMAAPMDIAAPAVDIPTPEIPVAEQAVAEVAIPEVPAVEAPLPEVPAVEIPNAEVPLMEQPIDMSPVADFQQAEAAPLIEVPQNIEQPVAMEQPVVEMAMPEVPPVEVPVTEAVSSQPADMATQIMPDIENTQILTDNMSPISEIPAPEISVPEPTLPEVPVTESVPTESVVTLEPGPVIEEQNPMAELAVPQPEPIPDPVSDFAQSINNPEVNLFAQNPSGLTIENIQATMQQQELSQNGESFVGIPAELANQSDVPTPVTDEIIPVGSEPPKVEESENEETKTIIHQSAPLGKVQPVAPISVYTEQTGSILPPEETADESDNTTTEQTEAEETPESVVEVTETSEDTEESVPEVNVEEEQPEEAQEDKQREETQNEDNSEEREKVISPIVTDEESDDTENSEEQTDEEEQPEETTDDDSDDKDKKSINIKDLDDIAIKILEEETKEVEVSTKQKHKVNIEDELYVEIDEAEAPKQSRNNKRKMIKGREKFKSNQKIVPLEEEPIIRFCKSCGNVVSKEKVVCENCGEPV